MAAPGGNVDDEPVALELLGVALELLEVEFELLEVALELLEVALELPVAGVVVLEPGTSWRVRKSTPAPEAALWSW
jgi:hypothetical protein